MEFPNPLLEPVEEIQGELFIPGNRALINLNLSGKMWWLFPRSITASTITNYCIHIANKIGEAGMKSLLDAVQFQSQLIVSHSKHTAVGLLRLSLKVMQEHCNVLIKYSLPYRYRRMVLSSKSQ
jgi:hypothetical protein